MGMQLSKNKISQYSGLGLGKMRSKTGLFAVEGWKSVSDSLSFFELEAFIMRSGSDVFDLHPDLKSALAYEKTYEVSASDMKKMSSLATPSDVMAVFRLPDKDDDDLKVEADKLYLMLDGVRDPGNMGTIVRTAHWFGITKIFASEDCVDIYNPKTIQSTMGSLGRVKVVYCNLKEVIHANSHIPVYGTLLDGENIYESSLSETGFIVMGNEGKGISPEIRELINHRLLIPPFDSNNHSESLNVGIATGVILGLFRKAGYIS